MQGRSHSAENAHRLEPIRSVLRGMVELVLPPVCPSCRAAIADGDAVCAACWSRMILIAAPVCPVYGTPFAHDFGPGALSPLAIADPPPSGGPAPLRSTTMSPGCWSTG